MLGRWGSSKQTGLEGLEVLHKVDTGDVGTTEVSEVQRQRLQGWAEIWESKARVAGPASAELCRQVARPGEMKTGLKQNPRGQGGCGICVICARHPSGGSI